MAPRSLDQKNIELASAIKSLDQSLQINISLHDSVTADAIKNGQIQKFEYTVELLWKTLKSRSQATGIDLSSPKSVFRHAFLFSDFSDEEKERALLMIDHRNCIAHEYKDYIMEVIHPEITGHLELIKRLSIIEIK